MTAPVTPFLYPGFEKTLSQLMETLHEGDSTILTGVEGVGKSSLVRHLAEKYREHGGTALIIDKACHKPVEFYRAIATVLGCKGEKSAVAEALIRLKQNNGNCLVILDNEGADSSPQIARILQQLCTLPQYAGSLRLLLVHRDYLLLPNDLRPDSDYHNWIQQTYTLPPLQLPQLESFLHYFALQQRKPTPSLEMGADEILTERSAGRIGQLIPLLLPLLDNNVITREESDSTAPTPAAKRWQPNLIFMGVSAGLVALTLAYFLVMLLSEQQEIAAEEAKPVFAEAGTALPEIKAPYQSSAKISHKQYKKFEERYSDNKTRPKEVAETVTSSEIAPPTGTEITALQPVKESPPDPLEIITPVVDHWMQSWQTQNLNAYLQHYTPDFIGDGKNSHTAWKIQRQRALSRYKWIRLQRSNIDLAEAADKQIIVRLWVKYEASNGYRDRTLKQLTLTQRGDNWLISQERNELVRRGH